MVVARVPSTVSAAPGPGFASPVLDAQRTFRAVMAALAEPGTVKEIGGTIQRCPGFSSAMTAIALALTDFETRLWLDAGTASDAASYIRFHTGAPICTEERDAAFAFVARPLAMPRLDKFALGSLDYPDRSTTILVDVESIDPTRGLFLTGPGIPGQRRLAISPLPPSFVAERVANRAMFPRGVDVIFCAGDRIAALPRSTCVGLSMEAR